MVKQRWEFWYDNADRRKVMEVHNEMYAFQLMEANSILVSEINKCCLLWHGNATEMVISLSNMIVS